MAVAVVDEGFGGRDLELDFVRGREVLFGNGGAADGGRGYGGK